MPSSNPHPRMPWCSERHRCIANNIGCSNFSFFFFWLGDYFLRNKYFGCYGIHMIGCSYNHNFETREYPFMLCLSLPKTSFHDNPAITRYWRTDSNHSLRPECPVRLIDSSETRVMRKTKTRGWEGVPQTYSRWCILLNSVLSWCYKGRKGLVDGGGTQERLMGDGVDQSTLYVWYC